MHYRKERMTLKKHLNKQLIPRLMAYLKPYWKQTSIAITLMIISMFCNIVNPYLLEIAIGGIAFLLYNPFKELYNLIENTICKPRRVYNNDKKGEEKTDNS